MPLYEYRCSNGRCAHQWEAFAGYDAPLPTCPRCLARSEKVIHAPKGPMFMRFAGRESVSTRYGFEPERVEAARREFPEFQHCIRENGDVAFDSLDESRRFADRFEAKYPHPEQQRAQWRAQKRSEFDGKRKKRAEYRAEMLKAAGFTADGKLPKGAKKK